MEKGDLVMVRSDIPPDYRIGGVMFTEAYHFPLRGTVFQLNRKTSKGNWYYDQEGKSSVVFSEEMLIPLDTCLTASSYSLDNGCSGITVSNNNATDCLVDLDSILNYKSDENKLQGKETADSGRDRREGSSVYGRRNKATIAIRHLSYKARYGKS